MVSLEVYSKGDLQKLRALLRQFSDVGVSDSTDIVKHLEDYMKTDTDKGVTVMTKTGAKKCPSCGVATLEMNKVREGIAYNGCPKCYYSEVV